MTYMLALTISLAASTLALPMLEPQEGSTTRRAPDAGIDVLSKRALSVSRAFPQDFPDPSIFLDTDTWYAFSTSSGGLNVPVAKSSDATSWSLLGVDALPSVGAWADADEPDVWAPDVVITDAGQYVLFYSAAVSGNTAVHCIGVATSSKAQGPYEPLAEPFACPQSQGGAIDASGFRDTDDNLYVVYKIDGNSIGHGGSCNNGVSPQVSTPIMVQQVQSDFHTPIGGATQILDRDAADGPLVEAPSLMRAPGGKYVLFFSSNCYSTTAYDISYAFADNIRGPYEKKGPFAETGWASGLSAPGGLDVSHDGQHALFHAGPVGDRALWVTGISVDEGNLVVNS